MESFDMFLNGNFVALPAFKERFGVLVEGRGYVIETKWQSALFQAGQCGAFVGVFAAGPVTNRLGYKYTTLLALVGMIATIFISFFVSVSSLRPSTIDDTDSKANSLSVLTVGQFFEGECTHCLISDFY
jgi:SP family general alpha glucoside:H+ symporter-like MFS transporter